MRDQRLEAVGVRWRSSRSWVLQGRASRHHAILIHEVSAFKKVRSLHQILKGRAAPIAGDFFDKFLAISRGPRESLSSAPRSHVRRTFAHSSDSSRHLPTRFVGRHAPTAVPEYFCLSQIPGGFIIRFSISAPNAPGVVTTSAGFISRSASSASFSWVSRVGVPLGSYPINPCRLSQAGTGRAATCHRGSR